MGIDDVSKVNSVKESFLKMLHYSLETIIFSIDIISGM